MDEESNWSGCSTLGPHDYMLWAVDVQGEGTTGFSLEEVIEAGLQVKLVGFDEGAMKVVIADCVADTMEHLQRHLHGQAHT
jgi:hypothetical protein